MKSILELIQLINSGTTSIATNPANNQEHHFLIKQIEDAYSRNFITLPIYHRAETDKHFTIKEINRFDIIRISNLKVTQRGQRFAETESLTGHVVLVG